MIWYWLQKSSKESTWTHIWQIVLLIWSSFLTHFTIDQTFTCTGGRFGFCAFSTRTTKPWHLSFSTGIYLVLAVQSSNECNRIHFFVCTIDLSNKNLFLLANAFLQINSYELCVIYKNDPLLSVLLGTIWSWLQWVSKSAPWTSFEKFSMFLLVLL